MDSIGNTDTLLIKRMGLVTYALLKFIPTCYYRVIVGSTKHCCTVSGMNEVEGVDDVDAFGVLCETCLQ